VRLPLALAGVASSLAIAVPVARADGDVVAAVAEPAPRHRRVVLVAMPEPVLQATTSALGPWSISVATAAGPPPADDLAASALARAHDATAVAWIDGEELVIYDALHARSERKAAPAEPAATDEVAAATIALSIKTSLRHPVVAAAPEAPPERPPVEVFAAPAHVEAAVVPARAAAHRPLHVMARVGAGLPLSEPSPTMTRIGGRLSFDLPLEPRLAIAVGVEAGPRAAIEHAELAGRYQDLTLAVGAEWRQELIGRWWLIPSIAGTVHFTRLDGTVLMPSEREISEPGRSFGADAELSLETGGRLRGGVTLFGSFLANRDRYKVRGVDVLVVPVATLGASLRISFQ
jgi:hypothetical protein